MNTMKMPGFTAEASFRNVIAKYQNTVVWVESANKPTIIPQRIKLREWACECDAATDICVCTSGGMVRVLHAVLGYL